MFGHRGFVALVAAGVLAASAFAQGVVAVPDHADGLYTKGETVGWTVRLPAGAAHYAYTVERNMRVRIGGGPLAVRNGEARIAVPAEGPEMLLVTVTDDKGAKVATLGAGVDPAGLKPTAERPADFDAFWAGKLAQLRALPMRASATPVETGTPAIEEFAVTLNSLNSQAHGYLARPKTAGKHPALLIYQYAGVYAIDPKWAAARAEQGWLVFNVSAHDMALDRADGVAKDYQAIGNADRETSYFLEMYLRDTRALDYLTAQPDWDGKVLVLHGASMGGQQSLVTAALNADKVTAVVVNEPAGADAHAEAAGRKAGYPDWAIADPKVAVAASYFDTVNFAPGIKAPTLVSVGLIDSTVTASGVWTMFNQIPAPKAMVVLVDADHMHVTPDRMGPWQRRQEEALSRLVKGERLP